MTGVQTCALPISFDFAVGVNDVGFGIETGAIIFGDLFCGVAEIREGNVVLG